jgi:sporulation protein YlmC with PRC-barrel domain
MKRSILLGSAAACFCLGVVVPLLAAPAPTDDTDPAMQALSASDPAGTCRSDVHAFNRQIEKDGYWLDGSDYGYGYPMGGIGYGDGYGYAGGLGDGYAVGGNAKADAAGYENARPRYEIRILLASANILAGNGQQQACESVLNTTRGIYKIRAREMHDRGLQPTDAPAWRRQQIATAKPVTAEHASFRSDQVLDTAVRSPKDEALGSIQDLVTSPKTGKIAYLIVARGGLFGFDKNYVPVPWDDFKATHDVRFLVLEASKATMDAAPEVTYDQTLTPAQFDKHSQEVDAYWRTHLTN